MKLLGLILVFALVGCKIEEATQSDNLKSSDSGTSTEELKLIGEVSSIQDNALVLKLASNEEVEYTIDNGQSIIHALNNNSSGKSKNKLVTVDLTDSEQEIKITIKDKNGRVLEKSFNAKKRNSRSKLHSWEGVDCEFDAEDVEEVVMIAGGDDNFVGIENGGDYAPLAQFLAGFGQYVGQSQKSFDQVGINKWVAASFDLSEYKGKVLCGSVQYHLKNSGSLWNTDSVSLFSYPQGENRLRTDCNIENDLYCWVDPISNHLSSWVVGNNMKFNYDLKNLERNSGDPVNMIDAINETGIIHAYVQDDVTVDFYKIRLLVKKSDEKCPKGIFDRDDNGRHCGWIKNNIFDEVDEGAEVADGEED